MAWPRAKNTRSAGVRNYDEPIGEIAVEEHLNSADSDQDIGSLRSDVGRPFSAITRSQRSLGLAGLVLPKDERERWVEEWSNEQAMITGRLARWRFTGSLVLRGAPQLAVTLRRRAGQNSGSRGAFS